MQQLDVVGVRALTDRIRQRWTTAACILGRTARTGLRLGLTTLLDGKAASAVRVAGPARRRPGHDLLLRPLGGWDL